MMTAHLLAPLALMPDAGGIQGPLARAAHVLTEGPSSTLFAVIGVVCSLLNTLAFYVDSKLFHYYTFELIVIDGGWRLLKDAVVTPLLGFLALELARRLRKAGLAQEGSK